MGKNNIIVVMLSIAVVALLVGLVSVHASPAPRVPVGYYDGTRVYGGSREAKAALDAVDGTLKKERAAAERTGSEYQAAVRDKASDADQAAKRAAAEAAAGAYRQADEAARGRVAVEVDRRIAAAVAHLAAARGMTLVLTITGKLPYAVPECDLTPDILVAVDAAGPVK